MAYADYEFYATEYFGNTIPETDFPKYAGRASDRIDIFTFGRLEYGLPTDEKAQSKVKKAVCAVADAMYQIDQIRSANMASVGVVESASGQVMGKGIKSKTAGDESITYESGGSGTDIYSAASGSKAAETSLLYDTAEEYLRGVTTDRGISLLYAGM